MKFRNLLWVGVALTIFSSCKDDGSAVVVDDTTKKTEENTGPEPIVVQEVNMSLINKLTATWCGPCGSWGWTLFQEIIDETHNDAVIMGTYGSSTSNYYNPAAAAFKQAQAPSAGWPAFCANGENRTAYSSNGGIYTATTKTNVVAEVAGFKAKEVIAGAGYRDTIIDGKIQLDVKTKFFKDGDESFDYYVGAYVVEDQVVGYQNGQGSNASHHHVLRSAMTTDVWGVKIDNGKTTGSEFEHTFELPVDATWNTENLEYAVVIWKKLGVKYVFVNAYQDKE